MIIRVPERLTQAIDKFVEDLSVKALDFFWPYESPYLWHEWRAWRPIFFWDYANKNCLCFVWGGKVMRRRQSSGWQYIAGPNPFIPADAP